jgi:hypothetical protein
MGVVNDEKRRFWEGQLALVESSGQRSTEFCRQRGLSCSAFAYWKRRLRNRPTKAVVVPKFIPVEIKAPHTRERVALPDPRWLAEFIGHLMGGDR